MRGTARGGQVVRVDQARATLEDLYETGILRTSPHACTMVVDTSTEHGTSKDASPGHAQGSLAVAGPRRRVFDEDDHASPVDDGRPDELRA